MQIFQEDDDLDLERELENIENRKSDIQRDFAVMDERSHHIRKQLKKKQLDPLVAKALDLAQNLGHVIGANESMSNRLENLSKRIAVRDEEIERTNDYDHWKKRAEAAEATLERSKKLKSRRK